MAKNTPRILAVDDEADMLSAFESILAKNYRLSTAASSEKAEKILKNQTFDLVLLDLRMPGKSGIDFLKELKEQDPALEVIMITASREIASAVQAIKAGAFDYITKPFEVDELKTVIEKALEKRALVKENLYLKDSLAQASSYHDLIGRSAGMQNLFAAIAKIGPADSTVLISGESGTGKELVARAIHKSSKRAENPFVAVNCAAIPDNLFESTLFGHERGSFTGALERKLGKFELADSGTLFLDEIGCMPEAMQAKLLRVLEERSIERLGGEKGIPIDVRIISATNINFDEQIRLGKFRHDLYYRLNVIPLHLIPLRERKDDLPLFIEYFLDKYNRLLNKNIQGFEKRALEMLLNYGWPGNVRELQNLIERVTVLSQGEVISAEEIPIRDKPESNLPAISGLSSLLEDFERKIIKRALSARQGNVSQAARDLQIVRTSLASKIKNLNIEV